MAKIPARHAPKLFAFFMSLFMAFIMTGCVTFINTGLQSGFFSRWMQAFSMVWPLAFVCILLIGGHVRKLVAKLTAE